MNNKTKSKMFQLFPLFWEDLLKIRQWQKGKKGQQLKGLDHDRFIPGMKWKWMKQNSLEGR